MGFLGYFNQRTRGQYSNLRVFQIGNDNVYSVRDFYKKEGTELSLPVMAEMEKDRFKILDLEGNNMSAISYCYTKTISVSKDVPNRWALVAVSVNNTIDYGNAFKILPTKVFGTCANYTTAEYKMNYKAMGVFADQDLELKSISFDGTPTKYYCIITKTYLEKVKNDSPPEVPPSSLYVEYNGKKYYVHEPIFIPKGQKNTELKLVTAANRSWLYWSWTKGNNYRQKYFHRFTNSTTNNQPLTIDQIIEPGSYILNAIVPIDGRYGIENEEYNTVLVSGDIELVNLGITPNATFPPDDKLKSKEVYTLSVSDGDKVYMNYQTPLKDFVIDDQVDKDQNGKNYFHPNYFTKVVLEKNI